jgi:hypothetical protein
MNSNPLQPVWDAYNLTQDSLKVIKRVVKTKNPTDRQRLLQRTEMVEQDPQIADVDDEAEASKVTVDELFLVGLWAAFERFLRGYLQNKGTLLTGIMPANLGEAIYNHFIQEVEYWKPDEILDFLKLNLLRKETQLAGEAKATYHYRSWIVHGKSMSLQDKVAPIAPQQAYETLDKIIQLLLATPDELLVSAIFEQGIFRPIQPVSNTISDGQPVKLLVMTH